MDNTRITIALNQGERAALMQLANAELRSPRDQARHMLRERLKELGLFRLPLGQSSHTGTDREAQ